MCKARGETGSYLIVTSDMSGELQAHLFQREKKTKGGTYFKVHGSALTYLQNTGSITALGPRWKINNFKCLFFLSLFYPFYGE